MPYIGATQQKAIMPPRISNADNKLRQSDDNNGHRHEQPQKVDFAKHVGVANQAVYSVSKGIRELGPRYKCRETENGVGNAI